MSEIDTGLTKPGLTVKLLKNEINSMLNQVKSADYDWMLDFFRYLIEVIMGDNN